MDRPGWDAYYMAIALLMALYHRERTGEGQWIDLSQYQSGVVQLGEVDSLALAGALPVGDGQQDGVSWSVSATSWPRTSLPE